MGRIFDFRDKAFDTRRYDEMEEYWGRELWLQALKDILQLSMEELAWESEQNPINMFRSLAEVEYARLQQPRSPMVFVSHSHKDNGRAMNLATLIVGNCPQYDVWLDIWDPKLTKVNQSTVSGRRKALLIALAVEVGLLNSSHLVALLTLKSSGSAWIPYEYARVKPRSVFSTCTSALLLRPLGIPCYVPEYLHLGEEFTTEQDVLAWL